MERKRQKEEGPLNHAALARVVLTDDDREMCRACGEYPAMGVGMYCRRCEEGIRNDRLERESGR